MEIGQYADLGMLIQNIKLLCEERQLFGSKLNFFSSESDTQHIRNLFNIEPELIIFCSMDISHLSKENKNQRNVNQKRKQTANVIVRAKL